MINHYQLGKTVYAFITIKYTNTRTIHFMWLAVKGPYHRSVALPYNPPDQVPSLVTMATQTLSIFITHSILTFIFLLHSSVPCLAILNIFKIKNHIIHYRLMFLITAIPWPKLNKFFSRQ